MCMDASTIRKAVSANHRWLHNRRQSRPSPLPHLFPFKPPPRPRHPSVLLSVTVTVTEDVASSACLLYTSDAADDLLCVDLGGRRIIKKKNKNIKKKKT